MRQLLKRMLRPPYKIAKMTHARYRLKKGAKQSPCRIVVGANNVYQEGWIPTDVEYLNLLKPDDWKYYFSENSIDAIVAEHVWEHLTREEGILAAKVCYQYLRPGGYLRVAVPDGLHWDPKYIDWVKPGGDEPEADDHKVLYTYSTLKEVFESAGFVTELLEFFDEHHVFHYKEWKPEDGLIHRSKRFDRRNQGVSKEKLNYTSIILDAKKQ